MKNILVNLLLAFCTIILMVFVGEATARYRGVQRLWPDSPFAHKLGRELPQNTEGRRACDDDCMRQGQNTVFHLNGIGVRDIDHVREKPDGTKRIIMLGDSMTEGQHVPLEQTVFRQLQKILDDRSPEKWEVISFASSGFGTLEEMVMLEELGLAYDPDIVIIQIYPNNDICDNSIKALGVCGSYPFRPYAIKSNGTLRRTTGQPVRNMLRRHSSLFVALETSFLKAREHISGPLNFDIVLRLLEEKMMERRRSLPMDPYSLNHIDEEYQPPFVKEGWEVTELLLTQLSESLHKKNIAFIAYEIPPVWEVEHPADQWDDYAAHLAVPMARGYGSKRLHKLFQILDRPFVPLLESFDEYRSEVLPYWDYHLNPNGHRIAAEAVFKMLQENGLASVKE